MPVSTLQLCVCESMIFQHVFAITSFCGELICDEKLGILSYPSEKFSAGHEFDAFVIIFCGYYMFVHHVERSYQRTVMGSQNISTSLHHQEIISSSHASKSSSSSSPPHASSTFSCLPPPTVCIAESTCSEMMSSFGNGSPSKLLVICRSIL